MLHGKPPSSRPPPGDQGERLEHARGELRDALGAARNLEQLLRSVKTGPRALRALIPDAAASCQVARRALETLLESLRAAIADRGPVDALERFVLPRTAELEQALERAANGPMNAKNRLALESVVSRAWRQIDAARELIGLFEDAIWSPRIRLDLAELVRETSKPETRPRQSALIRATLRVPPPAVEVLVHPRAAMTLLELIVNLVAASGGGAEPHIVIHGEGGFSVQREAADGEPLTLPSRPLIAPSLECMRAVASISEAKLEVEAQQLAASLFWQPEACGGRG